MFELCDLGKKGVFILNLKIVTQLGKML